jgi:CRP-like cAMP-binding protein
MADTLETLKSDLFAAPFCEGLDQDHLEVLLTCAHEERILKGRFLFHEGATADEFYIIVSGRVGLELDCPNRGGLSIQTCGAGDLVGTSWLIPPYVWRFDAKVLEDSRLISMDAAVLRERCKADLAFGYAMLERIAQVKAERLDAARLQLLDVYGNPEEGRHVARTRIN